MLADEDGLAELHESRGSETQTLDTIIEWAQSAVDSTDGGIFLLHAKGIVETVVPTSPQVAKAHDLQIEIGEGPCLEVISDENVDSFIIGDAATDGRFPKWGPEAAALGFHSIISVVLKTSEKRLGSLNIYSSKPHAFDRDDLAVIDIFSHRAARAIAVAEESAGLTGARYPQAHRASTRHSHGTPAYRR